MACTLGSAAPGNGVLNGTVTTSNLTSTGGEDVLGSLTLASGGTGTFNNSSSGYGMFLGNSTTGTALTVGTLTGTGGVITNSGTMPSTVTVAGRG